MREASYLALCFLQSQVNSHNGNAQNAANFFDSLANPELENLRKQLEDLQLVLYNKDAEIQQLKEARTAADGALSSTQQQQQQSSVVAPHQENGTGDQETEVDLTLKVCKMEGKGTIVENEKEVREVKMKSYIVKKLREGRTEGKGQERREDR